MRGGKPLAVLMIMSMLSACAGTHAPGSVAIGGDEPREAGTQTYADASDMDVAYLNRLREQRALVAAHRGGRHDHRPSAHYHEEPTPEQKAVAETVLLVTASVFVCTFVVVVLDGACNFGAHAGYYY